MENYLQKFIERKTIYSQATSSSFEEEIEIGYDAYYFDVSRKGVPYEIKIVVDKTGHWTHVEMWQREDTEQCESWHYLASWEQFI